MLLERCWDNVGKPNPWRRRRWKCNGMGAGSAGNLSPLYSHWSHSQLHSTDSCLQCAPLVAESSSREAPHIVPHGILSIKHGASYKVDLMSEWIETSWCTHKETRHLHCVDCGSNLCSGIHQLFNLLGKSFDLSRPLFPHVNKLGIMMLSGLWSCTV